MQTYIQFQKVFCNERIKKYCEALMLKPYLNEFSLKVSGGVQKKAMLVKKPHS